MINSLSASMQNDYAQNIIFEAQDVGKALKGMPCRERSTQRMESMLRVLWCALFDRGTHKPAQAPHARHNCAVRIIRLRQHAFQEGQFAEREAVVREEAVVRSLDRFHTHNTFI